MDSSIPRQEIAPGDLAGLLDPALTRRRGPERPAPEPEGAERLFHGFTEGFPRLAVDRYGSTLVVFDAAPAFDAELWAEVRSWLEARGEALSAGTEPLVHSVLWKVRKGSSEERRGLWVRGGADVGGRTVVEDGVRYAVDLRLQADASFYLDTRLLRAWLKREAAGRSLLNTFAYTGSLGVAAKAGGASRVVQVDRNPRFLAVAERSLAANGLALAKGEHRPNDFFLETARLRREDRLFDLVVVDPPFFSQSERGGGRGQVDLQRGLTGLLSKVRPLVAHQGRLVVVDNAVFHSGADFMAEIEQICSGGYLTLEETIPVPVECGALPLEALAEARPGGPIWPADPTPFGHPTKIAVLRARRKDLRPS
jgi:23S rRNA (cytosine1962-C5)-methyltransferase